MIPKDGGPPLPPAPICLGADHHSAREYLALIEQAMEQPGWSRNQRRRLQHLWRLWKLRSEGADPWFEQYGTFGRYPGSEPPTLTEKIVAGWRRDHQAHLTPEQQQRRRAASRRNRRYRRRGFDGTDH